MQIIKIDQLFTDEERKSFVANDSEDSPYILGDWEKALAGISGREETHSHYIGHRLEGTQNVVFTANFFWHFKTKIIRGMLEFYDDEHSRNIFTMEKKFQREHPTSAQFVLIDAWTRYFNEMSENDEEKAEALVRKFPLVDFFAFEYSRPVMGKNACARMVEEFRMLNSEQVSTIGETMREAILRNTYHYGTSIKSDKTVFEEMLDELEEFAKIVANDDTGSLVMRM